MNLDINKTTSILCLSSYTVCSCCIVGNFSIILLTRNSVGLLGWGVGPEQHIKTRSYFIHRTTWKLELMVFDLIKTVCASEDVIAKMAVTP